VSYECDSDSCHDTRAQGKTDTREQRGGRERDSRVYLGVLRHMCGRVVSCLSCSVSLCLSGRVATHVSSCRDVSCLVCPVLCLCVCRVCRVVCACGVATYLRLDITQSYHTFVLISHSLVVLSLTLVLSCPQCLDRCGCAWCGCVWCGCVDGCDTLLSRIAVLPYRLSPSCLILPRLSAPLSLCLSCLSCPASLSCCDTLPPPKNSLIALFAPEVRPPCNKSPWNFPAVPILLPLLFSSSESGSNLNQTFSHDTFSGWFTI